MSVEQYLTQEFGLTFLDARRITNEAKVSLQIEGYAHPEQEPEIRKAAVVIFQSQTQEIQEAMFQQKRALEAIVSVPSPYGSTRSLSGSSGNGAMDHDASMYSRSSSSSSVQNSPRKKRFGLFKRSSWSR